MALREIFKATEPSDVEAAQRRLMIAEAMQQRAMRGNVPPPGGQVQATYSPQAALVDLASTLASAYGVKKANESYSRAKEAKSEKMAEALKTYQGAVPDEQVGSEALKRINATPDGQLMEPVTSQTDARTQLVTEMGGDAQQQLAQALMARDMAPKKKPGPIQVAAGASLYDPEQNRSIYTAPKAEPEVRRSVEWKDVGDKLVPVWGDTGEDVPNVKPKMKSATPGQADNDARHEMKDIQGLRKEFQSLPAVKNFEASLPLYQRAATAPKTRAGDLSVVYALGKIFDPGSVVRGEELILSKDAQPWLTKIISEAKSQITGQAALDDKTRGDILDAMRGQVDSMGQLYARDRTRFAEYATKNKWDPNEVVGGDPLESFPTPQPAAAAPAAPSARKNVGGKNYVKVGDQWFEEG